MPKYRLYVWVKNVYNLRIAPWTSSVRLSPIFNTSNFHTHQPVRNSLLVRLFIPQLSPQLSTVKNRQSTLLYAQLYPQSTTPTIKTIKKK